MKGFLIFLLGILTIGIVGYLVPYHPCDTALLYKLGSVDSKFNFTNDEVIQDMQDATDIWSTIEGKKLFTYSLKGTLTVNFVYDDRTALNNQINSLQSQLSQSNSTLKEQIAAFKQEASDYEQKLAAFNAEVKKYNESGGAPADVYDRLKKEQQELNAEADSLNQKAKDLNISTHDYNNDVSSLNSEISQFNGDISQKPEEGLFDGTANTITIYLVNSHNELIHTLAHEFGHALGMMHVQDPNAIMYSRTSTFLKVTSDDMQQLTTVCKEQPTILHIGQEIDIWIIDTFDSLVQKVTKK